MHIEVVSDFILGLSYFPCCSYTSSGISNREMTIWCFMYLSITHFTSQSMKTNHLSMVLVMSAPKRKPLMIGLSQQL